VAELQPCRLQVVRAGIEGQLIQQFAELVDQVGGGSRCHQVGLESCPLDPDYHLRVAMGNEHSPIESDVAEVDAAAVAVVVAAAARPEAEGDWRVQE
jgi:hypothetical protein